MEEKEENTGDSEVGRQGREASKQAEAGLWCAR